MRTSQPIIPVGASRIAFKSLAQLNSSRVALGRTAATLGLGAVCLFALLSPAYGVASFQEDANGFVVMEAENFDLNLTQNNGEWRFDNTALAFDPYSGWGYMKGLYSGGIDTNLSPRLDFRVNFTGTGIYYIWVSGTDAGGKSVNIGLDGVVPASANDIGGPDSAFGARFAGELWWLSNHNDGSGYVPGSRPYLTVPTSGEHTVNVFIREPGFYLDRICLTSDAGFVPSPLYGGATSGLNVPAQTVAASPSLAVAITQPANGKTLYGGPSNSVPIVAKPAMNGPSVTKVEFFSKLASASAYAKIGEATSNPYTVTWNNSPSGSNMLIAVVTDGSAQKATSAVVNVTIALPPTFVTPLKWTTNSFDSGLGSFTLQSRNHEGGFDFGWQNSTNAGGPAGELGGLFVRSSTNPCYVAEPLSRLVTLNEDLWFHGSMMFSNANMNGDTFLGYIDTNSLARFGLKIREPSGSAGWRFNIEPGNIKITANLLLDKTVGQFELHWIPSGLGDGSGTLTGMVASVAFPDQVYASPNAATYNAFGRFVPTQGDTDTNRHSFQYFDNLAYRVPAVPKLEVQKLNSSQVLLSWAIPDYILQFADGALPGAHTNANWVDINPSSYTIAGGKYYYTNSVGGGNRWFQLRHPL